MAQLMPVVWICAGAVFAYGFILIGYNFHRIEAGTIDDKTPIGLPSFKRGAVTRKKPKSISEEELWKREQRQAPLDPGTGDIWKP